jgi:hypothetical protein
MPISVTSGPRDLAKIPARIDSLPRPGVSIPGQIVALEARTKSRAVREIFPAPILELEARFGSVVLLSRVDRAGIVRDRDQHSGDAVAAEFVCHS